MDAEIALLLADYPSIIRLPVQWGDMDALAHVNNVVYFRWLESSRVQMIDTIAEIESSKKVGIGPILASAKCDYRRQLRYPDTVHIASRIDKVGRSSATIKQIIVSESERAVAAEGEAILVYFNYIEGKPVPIEEPLRSVLNSLSGKRG